MSIISLHIFEQMLLDVGATHIKKQEGRVDEKDVIFLYWRCDFFSEGGAMFDASTKSLMSLGGTD